MSAQVAYDSTDFHVFQVSDEFAIHLSHEVIAQLTQLISRVESANGDGELRGILLGRFIDRPFPDKPSSDKPSRVTVIEAAAEGGDQQQAVGFFRAGKHDSLNLSPRDLDTFGRQFCDTGKVAVLIRTLEQGCSGAALYYWQNGAAHRVDLGSAFPLVPARSGRRIRWTRLLPTAALVIIGMWALQLASNSKATVAAAQSYTEASPADASALGLTLTSSSHQLEIRWNPASPAIAGAEAGVMNITEAGSTRAFPFDRRQLRHGNLAYMPATDDVSIAFEVTEKDGGKTAESVRYVAIR